MELVINVSQSELSEISKSKEFQLLRENHLARVMVFDTVEYLTDYVSVVTTNSPSSVSRYYDGLISRQRVELGAFKHSGYRARRIMRNPSIKARSVKSKHYYLVIDLSPKNFIALGVVGGVATAAIFTNPLIAGITGAIGTIIMTYMSLKAPFYMISEEEANFYSYLSASCFNSKEVTSMEEIKRIYEEDFLNVIKVINPSYELKEDFESIYDYFTDKGLIYKSGGEYKIRTTIKILNRKFGSRR